MTYDECKLQLLCEAGCTDGNAGGTVTMSTAIPSIHHSHRGSYIPQSRISKSVTIGGTTSRRMRITVPQAMGYSDTIPQWRRWVLSGVRVNTPAQETTSAAVYAIRSRGPPTAW